MPTIFWGTGEVLTSAVSICLPAMLNLVRKFSSIFLCSPTSKPSLLTDTRTQQSSFSKSNGTGGEVIAEESLDYRPSLKSESIPSQSMLVPNGTKMSVGIHKEGFELEGMSSRPNSYGN